MASSTRFLPNRRNPLLQPEHTPQLEILVERRKLGQTDLSVKPGQVGTSNATQPKNLGPFDYAHLRVPLPKDLKGSGVFQGTKSAPIPEAYFLMRRSSDGFVSATGMFKAAFPWASKEDEETEREYLKSFDTTDPSEVAGNLWVPESFAVGLAEEYGINTWIEALLDPEDVDISPAVNPNKHIATPPKFTMPKNRNLDIGDKSSRQRTTSRELRSASPTKRLAPTPASIKDRPKATPRKPRAKKNPNLQDVKPARETRASSQAANEMLSSSFADSVADSAADSGEERDVDAETEAIADDVEATVDETNEDDEEGEEEEVQEEEDDDIEDEALPENTVRVSVQADVTDDGETETTRTTVRVEMPADAPELALPKDASGMIEQARAIVERARELQDSQTGEGATPAPSASRKRKADEYEEDLVLELEANEELVEVMPAEADASSSQPPTKKLRVMVPAEEYRREKVTKRAFLGLSFSLAFGLMVPAISAYLGY